MAVRFGWSEWRTIPNNAQSASDLFWQSRGRRGVSPRVGRAFCPPEPGILPATEPPSAEFAQGSGKIPKPAGKAPAPTREKHAHVDHGHALTQAPGRRRARKTRC